MPLHFWKSHQAHGENTPGGPLAPKPTVRSLGARRFSVQRQQAWHRGLQRRNRRGRREQLRKTFTEVADHRRAEALPRTIVLRDPTSFGEAQKPTKAVAGPCTSYQLGFDEHLTNASTPIARERGFPSDEGRSERQSPPSARRLSVGETNDAGQSPIEGRALTDHARVSRRTWWSDDTPARETISVNIGSYL